MSSPYEILGIDENATDSQVRESYIAMQKKYDPDSYDKEDLKNFAKKKTEEITNAFDQIMNERRVKRMERGESITDSTESDEGFNASVGFSKIRELIDENDLEQAEMILNSIDGSGRSAEWYYLKGTIFFKKGWLDDSTNFFAAAVRMDPGNPVYKDALDRATWQKSGNFGPAGNDWRRKQTIPQGTTCSGCDICGGLLCADCCCECMGGDCIRCC
ncbi:MAG: DnaJ domain-containing protein [Oscillospiraceae bacterium]|nr:DnaJ domain-containing protein [Oscillospiraceae bacterium]MDE5853018.1 DnaJ domain-containing protein [Oscillospiraceae bacterium]